MSLFRVRDWWNTGQLAVDEEFNRGSIASGNLCQHTNGVEQIVVGSQNGVLRVLDLGSDLDEASMEPTFFRAEHLLLETQLSYPILQVHVGQFVSGSVSHYLAVLHPRKLTVYSLERAVTGRADYDSQYNLSRIYEHLLSRSAFNFVCGAFGGVKGRDFFCVQSLDGTVSMIEQESFAFSRFLPGSLLPGPLAYAPLSDSFITVSSSWQIESYKYQTLAVAADSETKDEAANVSTGKRVAPDWTFQLGEWALEAAVIEVSPAQPSVLVLGERSIFCFTEGGTLRFQKKLDYSPTCLLAYSSTSEGYLQFLIGTDTKTLLFYSDTTLRWAAQLTASPLAVQKINLSLALAGLLGILSAGGCVSLTYLGTDPSLFGLPHVRSKQINFQEKNAELRQLQARIKSSNDSIDMQASPKSDMLTVSCQVPPKLDDVSLAYDCQVQDDNVPSITVKLILSAKVPLESVQIFVRAFKPIVAHQSSFFLPTLSGSQELPVTFFIRYPAVPSSLNVDIEASFGIPSGGNKIVRSIAQLPLQLISKPAPPIEKALHKVTLECSKETVCLNDIFTEFLMAGMEGKLSSMGFQLCGSPHSPAVTILASKNNQRYRVQSNSLEAMWLFLNELMVRLARYFVGVSDFRLWFAGTLPLAEYFALIDHHFELVKKEQKMQELLNQRCAQLRAVQRQLLTKFKDTTPTPLAHLDGLLEMTYRQVLSIAGSLQELIAQTDMIGSALNASSQMLICLLQLQKNLPQDLVKKLKAALIIDLHSSTDQTWEDRADVAVTHLLHQLTKGTTAGGTNEHLPTLNDTTRLKKHIALLCEKLGKGMALDNDRLSDADPSRATPLPAPPPPPSYSRSMRGRLETIQEDTNATDVTDAQLGSVDVPVGSTFGEVGANNVQRSMADDFHGSRKKIFSAAESQEEIEMERSERMPMDGGSDVPDLDDLPRPAAQTILANGY